MKDNGETTQERVDQAIEAVRNGDRNAFAEVIKAYHVPVRALIGAQVADRHDADDIAQQTFVFAYQHIADYRLGTNCLAWLKAIARNKIRALWKQSAQTQQNLSKLRLQKLIQRSMELVDDSYLEDRLEALNTCVEQLPERQRDFLHRVNLRESTLADLAVEMNRNATAIRKQISRLYEKLRNCIRKRLKIGPF